MKMKHNKKRNTGFIYEAIIRELARSIHEGKEDKKSKIIKIIRESFRSTTLLGKDLDLYKSILETKNVDKYTAEKIIFQSKSYSPPAPVFSLQRFQKQGNMRFFL